MSNFPKPFLIILFCFLFPPRSFQFHMDKIHSLPVTLGALRFFSSLLCPWKRNLHSTHGVILVSFAGTVGNRNEKQKAENEVQRALRVCFLSVQKKKVVCFRDIRTAGLAQWRVCYSLCIELKEILSFECPQITAAFVLWWTKAWKASLVNSVPEFLSTFAFVRPLIFVLYVNY